MKKILLAVIVLVGLGLLAPRPTQAIPEGFAACGSLAGGGTCTCTYYAPCEDGCGTGFDDCDCGFNCPTGGGSCGGAAYPACAGSCPAGQVCKGKVGGNWCVCATGTGGCYTTPADGPELLTPPNGQEYDLPDKPDKLEWWGPFSWGTATGPSGCTITSPQYAINLSKGLTPPTPWTTVVADFVKSVVDVGSQISVRGYNFGDVGTSVELQVNYPKRTDWIMPRTTRLNSLGRINISICPADYTTYSPSGSMGHYIQSINWTNIPQDTLTIAGTSLNESSGCVTYRLDGNAARVPQQVQVHFRSVVFTPSATINGTISSYSGTDGNRQVLVNESALPNYSFYVGMEARLKQELSLAGEVFTAGTYYWDVFADNQKDAGTGSVNGPWSFVINAAANPTVAGTVYYDPDVTCAASLSTATNLGAVLTTTIPGEGSDTVAADGSFAIEVSAEGTYPLSLSGLPAGYSCSACAPECLSLSAASTAVTTNNFFVTDLLEGQKWWQAVGAGVYAGETGGGNVIVSELPNPDERLIIPGTGDLAAVVRASGSVDAGLGQISETNWSAISAYDGKKMDYRFFGAQMGVTLGTTDDFGNDLMGKPAMESPARDFYMSKPVSGVAGLDSDWSVAAGESYVVFVDGDLQIEENVTVAEGGFLAFIVNGGVTVGESVRELQGIYVMDELFTTQTGGVQADEQLQTGGMVVAWEGVSLNRDLGGVTNYTTPAEQFVYRPDLLVNMPDKMKSFTLRWREVEPGTVN